MNSVPFLDLKAQYETIREEVFAALRGVCEGCHFAHGPVVEAFEAAFARYCDVDCCVAVNSGTSALHLALRCLDIQPEDEVITVPMTFVATAWAVSYVGATPVFVDIDPATRTMDPNRLTAAITDKTKAIIPVHLYGMPADMSSICRIAEAHNLCVVEDAAQAHGARYRGERVGSIGRIGCFSFYPGKNLGAYGEGGALVTNDHDIAERARLLRDHGQRERYRHETVGHNYRMDGFQGAVLGVKLPYLDAWNEARRCHAASYRQRLPGAHGLVLPETPTDRAGVHHLFVVESEQRDRVRRILADRGVGTGLHYPLPVHLQPAYRHLRLGPGSFPVSEHLARRCLSLPMYPELTDAQIAFVCEQLAVASRASNHASIDAPAPSSLTIR